MKAHPHTVWRIVGIIYLVIIAPILTFFTINEISPAFAKKLLEILHISLSYTQMLIIVVMLTALAAVATILREKPFKIQSIEIVSAKDSLTFTVVKTLSETEKKAFLKRFQKIKFRSCSGEHPEACGEAVKIHYRNGSYEIVCNNAVNYVKDGSTRYLSRSCDETAFRELLQSFR